MRSCGKKKWHTSKSPAPMKDPFAMTSLPWLLKVTPRFSSVPPDTVYIVAICITVPFLASLSDWQNKFVISVFKILTTKNYLITSN